MGSYWLFHTCKFRPFGSSMYVFNLYARWHQLLWFKMWLFWGDRSERVGVGAGSCKGALPIPKKSQSLIHTLLLKDVSFSYNAQRHRQTDRRSDGQMTVLCQQPIILRASSIYRCLKINAMTENEYAADVKLDIIDIFSALYYYYYY